MMERERVTHTQHRQSGSFVSGNSGGSSFRRQSLSSADQLDDDDAECASVSEAGDIGDRSLRGSRKSWSGRHFCVDNLVETGSVVPILDETSLQPNDFSSHGSVTLNDEKGILHSTLTRSATTGNEILKPIDEKRQKGDTSFFMLEYICCLTVLALFGILGVITRYYLQKLFGPEVVGATSDQSYMYPDLPSNMVGSFLMGWLGVVFKGAISKVSDNLAIGLTTGFLGSLTTFSGWNQKLLELSVEGRWVFSVIGIVIGLFLAAYSIIFGIETAKGFQWLRKKWGTTLKFHDCTWNFKDYPKFLIATLMLLFLLTAVWVTCIIFEIKDFKSDTDRAELLLACIVGPSGVWIRWCLARWNGRGLGEKARLKWVPLGTLGANVLAASLMAALAILKKVVRNHACEVAATGIQLGFCGCLSTVSTFIAEFNAMRQSTQPWRAYAYALSTIMISFAFGTVIYSVPVWIKDYE